MHQQDTAAASTAPAASPGGEAQSVQEAIDRIAGVGSKFLRGEVNADLMANTMVQTVGGYMQRAAGRRSAAQPGGESPQLQEVLSEILGCGSGYLAGRCDAACVARTMTVIVRDYASH